MKTFSLFEGDTQIGEGVQWACGSSTIHLFSGIAGIGNDESERTFYGRLPSSADLTGDRGIYVMRGNTGYRVKNPRIVLNS